MSFYGISLAAANLVGFALSGIIVSRLNYQTLFFFGAALLVIGVVISMFLPGASQQYHIPAKTPPNGCFRRIIELLKRKGLIVAYCAIFAQYFTFGSVVTLLPLQVNNLGMEVFHVGMLLVIFAAVFIIVQLPSGAICDKIGRLRPIITGISLGIVSLVMLSSVKTFPLLAIAMILYGIGYGILFPSISALIADHTTPEERGLATGIFHALLTAGVAIGAPIMGWVGGNFGIETGLIMTPVVMALTMVIALTALKRL